MVITHTSTHTAFSPVSDCCRPCLLSGLWGTASDKGWGASACFCPPLDAEAKAKLQLWLIRSFSCHIQAALKKYQTEQRSKGDSLDKCQAELKKLRKKSQGSKNPQKYSDKELQVGPWAWGRDRSFSPLCWC